MGRQRVLFEAEQEYFAAPNALPIGKEKGVELNLRSQVSEGWAAADGQDCSRLGCSANPQSALAAIRSTGPWPRFERLALPQRSLRLRVRSWKARIHRLRLFTFASLLSVLSAVKVFGIRETPLSRV